jgi:hypothetical protein
LKKNIKLAAQTIWTTSLTREFYALRVARASVSAFFTAASFDAWIIRAKLDGEPLREASCCT